MHTYCIIHPTSYLFLSWNFVIFILLVSVLIVAPYQLAFPSIFKNETTYEYAMDFIFFLDVLVTFNTAYYDK